MTTDALAPYPSPDERERELDELAAAAGGEVRTYGESVEGRPLRVVRVPCRGAAPKGNVLCAANIHGVEWIGNRVAHGVLRAIAEDAPDLAALRDDAVVWIAPCLNPDGYARTFAHGGAGTVKELRTNAHGVDLNRNFPPPPGRSYGRFPTAGSDDPVKATFRGEAPLSEPETNAFAALCDEVPFRAAVSLHSFMGTFITPRVPEREDYRTYGALCAAAGAAQPKKRYRRLASRLFDMFTGELEDHLHHVHGTWATCMESYPVLASFTRRRAAKTLFWRFNPPDPEPWVENDVPAVLAWLRAGLEVPPPAGR